MGLTLPLNVLCEKTESYFAMRLERSTLINLPVQTVLSKVQTEDLLSHIAWPLIRFDYPKGQRPVQFDDSGQYETKLWLFGILPIGHQTIKTSAHVENVGQWPARLRDDGSSHLIKTWDHWITIKPVDETTTHYTDSLTIDAGVLTPFVWLFAQIFYAHRQRRWRELGKSLYARDLISIEMQRFSDAQDERDSKAAWRALERAHIISQPFLWLHLSAHWRMLRLAMKERQVAEIGGQLLRLALTPFGAITGKLPIGNTGRSNVSPFLPMELPEDLAAKFKGKVL